VKVAFVEAALNPAVDAITALVTHVSLHTGDPGSTGASEVAGGSPAYGRQGVTYTAADDGQAAIDAVEEFNIPASTTVTHFGLWTASTAGTFLGGFALSANETFTNQGVYRLTSQTVSIT
jgi:hypothetical protein